MAVFDHFKKSTGNLLRSDQIGDKDLALYSIYFSKNIQNIILEKLARNLSW